MLELRIPHGTTWSALGDSLPVPLTYPIAESRGHSPPVGHPMCRPLLRWHGQLVVGP
jgi:hypothetical protein